MRSDTAPSRTLGLGHLQSSREAVFRSTYLSPPLPHPTQLWRNSRLESERSRPASGAALALAVRPGLMDRLQTSHPVDVRHSLRAQAGLELEGETTMSMTGLVGELYVTAME